MARARHSVASRLSQIEGLCEILPNTLVIFDIDDVLITAEDTVFSPRGERSGIKASCLERLSQEIAIDWSRNSEWTKVLTIFLRDSKRRIVDKEIFDVLKTIRSNSNFIGLTSLEVGSHGVIPDMIQWRQNDFKTLGIEFHDGTSMRNQFSLSKDGSSKPCFVDNVIYTDREDKGLILRRWFDYIQRNTDREDLYRPRKIIVIDDLVKNLSSIAAALESSAIDCEYIHFTGSCDFPVNISLDNALWQTQHLFRERIWIRDCELREARECKGIGL